MERCRTGAYISRVLPEWPTFPECSPNGLDRYVQSVSKRLPLQLDLGSLGSLNKEQACVIQQQQAGLSQAEGAELHCKINIDYFPPLRTVALCADAALHTLEPVSRLLSSGGAPAHHADALRNASGCASVVRGTGTPKRSVSPSQDVAPLGGQKPMQPQASPVAVRACPSQAGIHETIKTSRGITSKQARRGERHTRRS